MKTLNFTHRPRLGLFVFAIFLIGVTFALSQGPSYWWAVAYVVHFFIFSFGVGFGLHRILAHQAGKPPPNLVRLSALVGTLAQVGSPISWTTVHLLHHAHSDGELDPHSPTQLGWRVILGSTKPVEKSRFVEILLTARSVRDPFLMFLHKYYYLITVAYGLITIGLFGVNGLVYLTVLPIGLSFLSLGLLTYFGHGNWGYQNFKTQERSANVWWLWPLTFGENWHNNHHKYPARALSRVRSFELDAIHWFFVLPQYLQRKTRTKTNSAPISPDQLTPPPIHNL